MNSSSNILFLITARKGSEGLKNKNMKLLGEYPLIQYSYDFAKSVTTSKDIICISTNDKNIFTHFKKLNIPIHFNRPDHLAKSTSLSDDVIEHALNFFKNDNKSFQYIFLLQPTSPFRLKEDFHKIKSLMTDDTEMVVSVKKCKDSPFFNQFKEGKNKTLVPLIENKKFKRRQDLPITYAYNGAYYYFRVNSFEKTNKMEFKKVKKFEMPFWRSTDIDTHEDWELAELYLKKYILINT
tara:strand:- start:901 stop:1614 length:714 start_codon:yes stop_codon:yes gene_type:complete